MVASDSIRTPIERLPRDVVERIAAGEIIERPASIVRELLDNALDAGATAIRIQLAQGGLDLVRVTDNGRGIPSHELALACQPHTTSKLHSVSDLATISTLGFRGEALASIAAVADLEIASAADDAGLAHTISMRSGATEVGLPLPRSRGTTVTVRDLFAAVPARRATLQSAGHESRHVLTLIQRYAAAYADVRFTLVTDERMIVQTPGDGLNGAVRALFGADVARALISLEPPSEQYDRLSGFMCGPHVSHATRNFVVLTINGRLVENQTLLEALEAGYRSLLPRGRHPLAVIHIRLSPDRIDANVHPAKRHVLVRDETSLARALRDAAHDTIGHAPLHAASTTHTPQVLHDWPQQLRLPAPRKRRGLPIVPPAQSTLRPRTPHTQASRQAIAAGLEALYQFDESLIIARTPDGDLYLVDQHRAHERILYERLTTGFAAPQEQPSLGASSSGPGQMLLEPMLIELTPLQAATLETRIIELRSLGFDCESFGGSTFLVRSIPLTDNTIADARDLVEASIHDAADDASDWRHRVATSVACRSALKRGEPLAPDRQRALLADLARTSAPAYCPHGSPLLLRLSRDHLVRTFGW